MTYRQALDEARASFVAVSNSPELDAEVLLAAIVGGRREELLVNDQEHLTSLQGAAWQKILHRRQSGEPVAYILGHKAFCGLDLIVTPDVLIPRPFTEEIVAAVIKHIPLDADWTIADIGTGSGAILLACLAARKNIHGLGTDISPAALGIARRNAERYELANRITWREGPDLAAIADDLPIDVLVANLPYLPTAMLGEPSIGAEPSVALAGGPDGMSVIRTFFGQLHANDIRQVIALECLPEHIAEVQQRLARLVPTWATTMVSDGQNVRGIVATQPVR